MAKRRSFEDGLTADQEAFLKKGKVERPAKTPKPKPTPKSQPKKEEPAMSRYALKRHEAEESPTLVVAPAPINAPVTMSNLSVRMDPRITAATLRAMTERRIQGIVPQTQQDIVAEAMVDWLKKNGYPVG